MSIEVFDQLRSTDQVDWKIIGNDGTIKVIVERGGESPRVEVIDQVSCLGPVDVLKHVNQLESFLRGGPLITGIESISSE